MEREPGSLEAYAAGGSCDNNIKTSKVVWKNKWRRAKLIW